MRMDIVELRQYGKVVMKRWWLVAGLVLIACSVAWYYSFIYVKPMYQATAKLIVNKSDSESEMSNSINVSQISANILLIKTYKEIIRTAAVMDKVVERLPDMELTSERLIRTIHVDSFNDTQVMQLAYNDVSYERAMRVVNTVTDVFREAVRDIMHVDNVTVLEYAKPMSHPTVISTNATLNMMVAFVFSFIVAVGICFFLEYLDDTVKTEQDVAKLLDVPTLAIVRRITKHDVRPRKQRKVSEQRKETPYATVNQ